MESLACGDKHIAQVAADSTCQWVATTHRDRFVNLAASPGLRDTDVMLVLEYQ